MTVRRGWLERVWRRDYLVEARQLRLLLRSYRSLRFLLARSDHPATDAWGPRNQLLTLAMMVSPRFLERIAGELGMWDFYVERRRDELERRRRLDQERNRIGA